VLERPSPNFGARREGARPDLVVLHYTAMRSAEAALERLCDPAFEVSAHWLVGRDGRIWRLVDEAARAWHAGAGAWGAVTDVNSRSIGIEIDNDGDSPFAEPAMAALEPLLAGVLARWAIPPERVIGHSDMAPGRKGDPGPRFDWARLARLGLACPLPAPDPAGADAGPGEIDAVLARIGYTAGTDTAARLAAFRLRFRPGAAGPVSAADLGLARALARRWPVDGGAIRA
jgi:N-acetylmuramoyl-L-alanine amidase